MIDKSWLPQPCVCGSVLFEATGFGLDYCMRCGIGRPGALLPTETFFRADRVLPKQFYTRRKRFKKYLNRASLFQSASTIPQDTWAYLLKHGPYRGAKHIQCTLKKARHLKRKCYDSLPLLTKHLCPHITVPILHDLETREALRCFDRIDREFGEGPFISYLYCLEYILRRMGRDDICPFINRIQCTRRRAAYRAQLDGIFKSVSAKPFWPGGVA